MHEWQSMAHVKWDCKYHVVLVPKYRKRSAYRGKRRALGEILRSLCRQRGIELLEGNAQEDHVHMCVSIPPRYSVSYALGFLKGKSAIRMHRDVLKDPRLVGKHLWARGYCVSTVGLDEESIRQYVREQEKLELGQSLFD